MAGRDCGALPVGGEAGLPDLVTVDEVARWLRTTVKAIYALKDRGQIPGVVRVGRRVLFERVVLLDWYAERRALSRERNSR